MRYSKNKEAFTLIEILIVSVVIATLAMLFGGRVMKQWEKIKKNQTKTMLTSVKNAMIEYEVDEGKKAKSIDDLLKYFKGEPPLDAWNNEIILNRPPERYTDKGWKYEIYSPGPDDDPDNEDDNVVLGE